MKDLNAMTARITRRFQNLEGLTSYDFSFEAGDKRTGVSAMLRVKNEAPKIRCCLGSVFDLFDEIVVIDNGSSDGTQDLVRQFQREHDRDGKIALYDYPFSVSRCGPEHDATPEDSVHSLAYYYNWALSHCTRGYVCKWDADMVARREERGAFKDFLRHLDRREARAVLLKGQTVYKDASGRCFLSTDDLVAEPRVFPYGSENYYIKVEHYEALHLAPTLPTEEYGGGVVFYELKFVDEDEFSHWSTRQFPSPRKRLEWENVERLRSGASIDTRLVPLHEHFLADQCGDEG